MKRKHYKHTHTHIYSIYNTFPYTYTVLYMECLNLVTLYSSSFFTVAIKKMSRVSGVTVIQSVELVPLGKSTPDFTRKPMALNVQEGKDKSRI